ncbi:MAG TPA: hypothetical protein VG733_18510 [Chthoniobacteraceae bacterium]|nr:hypothetical protein [Chthoniobacteraceae bacterium]
MTSSTSIPAPAASPTADAAKGRRAAIIALALVLALYAVFIATHMGAYAGGSDSSGYMNSALLFDRGVISTDQRTIPGLDPGTLPARIYTPLGFDARANGRMVPTYSTGLPLVMTAISRITGWNAAPGVTMFLFSLAGIAVTGWFARTWGLDWKWTLLAVLLVALSPLYLMYSMQLMSDLPAMVFTTAALTMAWKSRSRTGWAAGAGVAFAGAVLTRHTNTLLLPALALCFGVSWRRWAAFALAGLPGGAFYCLYNHANYGHYFSTGYTQVGEMLSAEWLAPSLRLYLWGLPLLLTPLVFLAAGLPFLLRKEPLRASALVAWIVCLLGFYSFYRCTHETLWYLRFVMPVFPALAIGAMMVLRDAFETQTARRCFEWLAGTFRAKIPPLLILGWALMILAAIYVYRNSKYEPRITRYLLLAIPLVCAVAMHRIRAGFGGDPAKASRATAAAFLVALVCAGDLACNVKLMWFRVGEGEVQYPGAGAWARENLPPNAVIYSMQTSGALFCYTPFTLVRWDFVTRDVQAGIEKACAASGRPVYAMLFPEEIQPVQDIPATGRWTRVATLELITCWRFDPGQKP